MGYIHNEIFSTIKKIEFIYLQEYGATGDNNTSGNKSVSEIQISHVLVSVSGFF